MKTQAKPPTSLKETITNTIGPVKDGQILEGAVIEMSKSSIFIDFGPLGVGIILPKEIKENPYILKDLEIGKKINCLVLETENEKGYIEVSVREARKELSWEKLEELKNNGDSIMAKVSQANRGGLVLDVMGQSGFMPVSQLTPEHYPRIEGGNRDKILQELNKFVGKELKVKIIDLNQREDKLIVSEKALSKDEINKMMDYFKIGEAYEGTVAAVTDFGAFIKLESDEKIEIPVPEGLVHISEIDWQLVKNPREFVKEGEKIKVKVIGFHQGRPALSIKALKEKPSQ